MKTEEQNKVNEKRVNLNEILKAKILYDNVCYKHNMKYSKYCCNCTKDICIKCENDNHINHKVINYSKLIPDFSEINLLKKNAKLFEYDKNIFFNSVENWKKEFNQMLNNYKIKVDNILSYIQNFNFEKINFNLIYKYRIISDYFYKYDYNNINNKEKNKKIIQIMERNIKSNESNIIKSEYKWLLNNISKLKEFIKYFNIDSFKNNAKKIIDIIDDNNNINDINKLNKLSNIKEIISPEYINDKRDIVTMSSSGKNKKTTASSGFMNNLDFDSKYIYNNSNDYNKKFYNNTIDSSYCDKETKASKSTNNINKSSTMSLLNFGIYEKKSIRQKSTEYVNNLKRLYLNKEINSINIFNKNYIKGETKTNIKMNSNILQNSINDTKILFINHKKDIKNKINHNKTNNFINKSVFNNYNNTSSLSNKRKTYINQSFKYNNNSLDKINIYKNYNELGKIYKIKDNKNINNIFLINNNNNIFDKYISKNRNRTNESNLTNLYKPKKNNSVENSINTNKIMNNFIDKNNIDVNYILTTNNAQRGKNLYVKKKFITLDMSKSMSSFESNTSGNILSSSSKKINLKNSNDIFFNNSSYNDMNKNKTNYGNKSKKTKLYLGLVLGDTHCKLAIYDIEHAQNTKENNFTNKSYNQNNSLNFTYIKVPTIISFIPLNNNINKYVKIGEEAKNLRQDHVDQTIFNIIKMFGQNTHEIIGKKELWPFNIYKELSTNKALIKIKNGNNNNDIYYNIEEILYLYLKKLFEMFFDKIGINNNEKKNIYINMTIGVPNYFNYLQRDLLKKILSKKLFPIKNNNNDIKLNNIFIENISNLPSYTLFENYLLNNDSKNNINIQKYNFNVLILSIEGCSTNISIIKLFKENKNNFIEIKSINSGEFGSNDFLDNFIFSCLSDFKEKIRNLCLNSPLILAKLRQYLNEAKKKFDKEETKEVEIIIDNIFGRMDLKLIIKIENYYKACLGLFRKIVYLLKEAIINSKIDINNINDIILIGNMTHNRKLKKMLSELFKEKNKYVYNKLTKNNIKNKNNNYILKGALIHCFDKSNIYSNKFNIINISHSSIGVETLDEKIDFGIKKGDNIPIKINKFIKIKKNKNSNYIVINVFEGDNKSVNNNKLISSNNIDINNLICNKKEKEEKYVELLFQFFIDSNYNLSVSILDKNTYNKQFECLYI